jgi:hypothetical protein
VEHLINICLDLVFKPTPPISAQDLENLGILERHETLGRLLKNLRTEVEVHPQLIDRHDFRWDSLNARPSSASTTIESSCRFSHP